MVWGSSSSLTIPFGTPSRPGSFTGTTDSTVSTSSNFVIQGFSNSTSTSVGVSVTSIYPYQSNSTWWVYMGVYAQSGTGNTTYTINYYTPH
jgi:hypothetical protein